MANLAAMEAADAAPAAGTTPDTPTASAKPEAERAASAENTEGQPPKAGSEGAPATEQPKPDDAKPDPSKETAKPQDKPAEPAPDKPQSKYEKNRVRLEGGWKELNAEKATVRATADTLKQREAELAKREAAVKEAEAKARQPKYTPDDYERAALQFEEKGQYDLADAARAQAKELRDNPPPPPPTDAQAEAQYQAEQKEWWGKAATDFPKVAVKDSAENKALQALIAAEPGVLSDPKGLYYAARLVNAESSAASVPGLTQQVSELTAKVKELEGKLAVPAGGAAPGNLGPVPYEQKTEAEQEAELYAQAREMGAFN